MLLTRPDSAGAWRRSRFFLLLCGALLFVLGCSNQPQSAPATTEGEREKSATDQTAVAKVEAPAVPVKKKRARRERPKRNLSEYGLFEGDLAELRPAAGVMLYDINSALFSDYAWKHRVIKLPDGQTAEYRDGTAFDFPVGTVIAKTFYFPHDFNDPSAGRRIVETRILLRRDSGWIGVPYVWNEEQTEAVSEVAGATVEVSWKHYDGSTKANPYIVPNGNDCKRCHNNGGVMEPIGPKARNLNKEFAYEAGTQNQLAHWRETGFLTGGPEDFSTAPKLAAWDDETSGTVDQRARAWLEINCAHCHSSTGPARNSGLYLTASVTDPYKLGIFKSPVAAGRGSGGRKYDIVPGEPDESIMMFRLESTHPGMAMPEFGRSLVHEESNALIRQWIDEMEIPEGFDVTNAIGEFQSLSEEQLRQFALEVTEKGHPARGEEIFHRRRLSCFRCHSVGGVGEKLGPDLTEGHDDKTLEYLIEAVLLPNKVIRKGFETVTVLTSDGQAYSGVVLEETPSELVLRDLTRPEIRIPKAKIEERAPGNSLMPTNVVAMLTRDEVVDLIRFLTDVGQPGPFGIPAETVVRRWQTLDPLPLNIEAVDVDKFVAALPERRDLTWEPVYSYMSGALDLTGAIVSPQIQPRRRVLQADFEVVKPGELTLKLNSTDGLRLWVDGKPVAAEAETPLQVKKGRHELVFVVDLDHREDPSLRCEFLASGEAAVDLKPAEQE